MKNPEKFSIIYLVVKNRMHIFAADFIIQEYRSLSSESKFIKKSHWKAIGKGPVNNLQFSGRCRGRITRGSYAFRGPSMTLSGLVF